MFTFLRNCQIVFQCAYTFYIYILHPPAMDEGLPYFTVFLTSVILVGMKWYLTVFLSCISLMINNECFSMCLLDILAYSLDRCLLKAFAFNLVVFLLLNCMTSWFKFLIRCTACIFFPPINCLFLSWEFYL